MSRRRNFLRWLRQWKPPAEVIEEAETDGLHITSVPAPKNTQDDKLTCPWCCEARGVKHWNLELLCAWQLHYKRDEAYYYTCTECRDHERVWAVGSSGKPYHFGMFGETAPRIGDDYGIMVDALAAGQLLGYNRELGEQQRGRTC